tara:strand:+ start:415 stop:531 length:117 start_codon:yes stop_codon:yes gene_type:complete
MVSGSSKFYDKFDRKFQEAKDYASDTPRIASPSSRRLD